MAVRRPETGRRMQLKPGALDGEMVRIPSFRIALCRSLVNPMRETIGPRRMTRHPGFAS